MSYKISTEGFFMHDLTEITLRENYDGIHVKETVIGYIAEEPFCVLTELLSQYYISQYDLVEIFPAGFFSGKYTIGIRNIGSKYSLDNFTKHPYYEVCRFLKYKKDSISLAEIDTDVHPELSEEYIRLLNNCSSGGQLAIELAIKYNEIIQEVGKGEQAYETTAEFNMRIHEYFTTMDISSMGTIELKYYFIIQQYVFKRLAEMNTMD